MLKTKKSVHKTDRSKQGLIYKKMLNSNKKIVKLSQQLISIVPIND